MPEQRHTYRAGHSLVVALPPSVQEHLGIRAGEPLYWHLIRGREAVITVRPHRLGGRPEGLALARQLEASRAEVDRLRRKVHARPLRVLSEGVAQGAEYAMREMFPIEDQLKAVRAALDELLARVPYRGKRAPRRRTARPVEEIALPDLPSSPSSVAGEAVAPGEQPPGHPMET